MVVAFYHKKRVQVTYGVACILRAYGDLVFDARKVEVDIWEPKALLVF